VADLTDALGIKPPSFYGAFGSKAGLYGRVIERYGDPGAVPLADLLRPLLTTARLAILAFTQVLHD
jgi:TetR/AcrR family transcriptional repressor for divergent bdcA